MSNGALAEISAKSGTFAIVAKSGARKFGKADLYSAAMAFVRGDAEIYGDIVDAVRFYIANTPDRWRHRLINAVRLIPWQLQRLRQSVTGTAADIQFHYDRSNEFYRLFLDSRMVYSCAYYQDPRDSLDLAQLRKLNHICRKLRLTAGERLLDIGCGWGSLLLEAAQRYGALALGCTVSHNQAQQAREETRRHGAQNRVTIAEMDYRDVDGTFDKIASVGMFEHVGRSRLRTYFQKVFSLLKPGGLFLNHGITAPEGTSSGSQGVFISRAIFPEGQILSLGEVIKTAEQCGFEVLDVEGLRRHYALTCRAWVERLRANRDQCLAAVDERTWRAWQLYLAGSAVAFEDGRLSIHQVLFSKIGRDSTPLTRDDIYRIDGDAGIA